MNVQINKAGSHHQAAGIEFLMCRSACLSWRPDLRNLTVTEQDVHGRVDPGGRVDQPATLDQQAVIPPWIHAPTSKLFDVETGVLTCAPTARAPTLAPTSNRAPRDF